MSSVIHAKRVCAPSIAGMQNYVLTSRPPKAEPQRRAIRPLQASKTSKFKATRRAHQRWTLSPIRGDFAASERSPVAILLAPPAAARHNLRITAAESEQMAPIPPNQRAKANRGRWRWWYASICDYRLAHPGCTNEEIAQHLGKHANTIHLITTTDLYREYE